MAIGFLIVVALVQAGAFVQAIRAMRRRAGAAWALVALAMGLMLARRVFVLAETWRSGGGIDPVTGTLALIVALLLFAGLSLLIRWRGEPGADSAGAAAVPLDTVQRMRRYALGLGIAALLGTSALVCLAYEASRREATEHLSHSCLATAQLLERSLAASARGRADGLALLRALWVQRGNEGPRDYLCAIGSDGVLLLNTRFPKTVGLNVGATALSAESGPGPATVGALLAAKRDWVGRHRSPRGEELIAAYTYSPALDAVVAVYLPSSSADAQIHAMAKPWALGFAGVLFVLLPLSLGLLHRAGVSSQRSALAAVASKQKSDERYRRIVETTHEGIWVVDTEHRTTFANGRMAAMLGTTVAEMQGRSLFDFIDDADREKAQASLASRRDGQVEHHRFRFRRADGGEVWADLATDPMLDAQGNSMGVLAMVTDVSERRRVEAAIRAGEDRFRSLIEDSSEFITVVNNRGGLLYASPTTERILGYQPGASVGRSAFEFVHPDDVAEVRRVLGQALVTADRPVGTEFRVLRKDGAWALMEAVGRSVDFGVGEPCVVINSRDITRERLDQAWLQARSDIFKRLLTGQELRLVLAALVRAIEARSRGMTGSIMQFDARSKRLTMLAAPNLPADFVAAIDHSLAGPTAGSCGTAAHFGRRVVVSDIAHDPLWAEHKELAAAHGLRACWSQPIISAGRNVLGTFALYYHEPRPPLEDEFELIEEAAQMAAVAIERRQAEEHIRELAAFAERNPNPVLEFEHDGTLRYANEAASELALNTGFATLEAFLPPDVKSIVADCLATGRNRLRRETQHGSRTISWSFFPVPELHRVHCYAGDITERTNLELQLRQSQKMEAIGQLAGGIAHDFNNILTVIQMNASLLNARDVAAEDARESAAQIGQAADRAASLTRQLLVFSRKQAIKPVSLDLNATVANTIKMLERILGEHVALRTDCAPGLPHVQADLGMVEQVLLNLAVNARDAMPHGGQLTIATAARTISPDEARADPGAKAGPVVCLSFQDTGVGIAPTDLPHIFEPFFTTKKIGQGTGLGLATVFGIVQQHHGWIRVSSRPGAGTTFSIFLPQATEALPAAPAPRRSTLPSGTETLLVVEDDAAVRPVVEMILQRCGYRVLTAVSGVEAMDVWRRHRDEIQLVLTDMVMPGGMTGLDLAQKLKAENPGLKIVFMSGYSAKAGNDGPALVEGDNFLQKPYQPLPLAQIIRHNLDRA
jgi:PAS domain S-box-containing protein